MLQEMGRRAERKTGAGMEMPRQDPPVLKIRQKSRLHGNPIGETKTRTGRLHQDSTWKSPIDSARGKGLKEGYFAKCSPASPIGKQSPAYAFRYRYEYDHAEEVGKQFDVNVSGFVRSKPRRCEATHRRAAITCAASSNE